MSDTRWRWVLAVLVMLTLTGCSDGRPGGECGFISGYEPARDIEHVEDGYKFRASREDWQAKRLPWPAGEQDSATMFLPIDDAGRVVIFDECPEQEGADQ